VPSGRLGSQGPCCGDLAAKSLAFLEPKGIDLRLIDASAPAEPCPREDVAGRAVLPACGSFAATSWWSDVARSGVAPGHYPSERRWLAVRGGLAFTVLLAKVLADLLAK
jgi:hypothetical protein